MKTFLIILIAATTSACNKSQDNLDKGCGCSTDSVYRVEINTDAFLYFEPYQNNNVLFISIKHYPYPDVDMCKICNPDLPAVQVITENMSKDSVIPVVVSGKLKLLCEDETFGFQPATHHPYHIVIDSIIKK